MPAAELAEWEAYHRTVRPLPDPVWQAGMVASVIANQWAEQPTTPEDFIPRVVTGDEDDDFQDPAIGLARMRMLSAGLNPKGDK